VTHSSELVSAMGPGSTTPDPRTGTWAAPKLSIGNGKSANRLWSRSEASRQRIRSRWAFLVTYLVELPRRGFLGNSAAPAAGAGRCSERRWIALRTASADNLRFVHIV